MKKHIFPQTVRNQIIISTAAITLIIAAITVTICFSVFQSFLRKAEIQSAEFNMQVISNNVSADMDHIFCRLVQQQYRHQSFSAGFSESGKDAYYLLRRFFSPHSSLKYLQPVKGAVQ